MRAFANIEPVESTEKFWRTFFSPIGCFRIVRVTKDFTSEKIKKLMKDYAPENAKYVCEIPSTTVEDVCAGTIEAVCNKRRTHRYAKCVRRNHGGTPRRTHRRKRKKEYHYLSRLRRRCEVGKRRVESKEARDKEISRRDGRPYETDRDQVRKGSGARRRTL